MFGRDKRASDRDVQTDGQYGNGAAFQPGDGYAGDGVADDGATTRTVPATGGNTRAAAVADRPTARPVGAGTAGAPTTAAEARAIQRDRFGGADGTAIF